jgi:hypothetical protein
VSGRLRYIPYYTPPLAVAEKLPVLAGTPFSFLRLLAAYELRDHAFDEKLYDLLSRRLDEKDDIHIRATLFESWIVANLNRLQATEKQVPRRARRCKLASDAFDKLQRAGASAAILPDPQLALDAAKLARWFRDDHPENFGKAGR